MKDFGADSLRLYEMFMGPFDQSIAWSTSSIIGSRRFLEKVWRLQERVGSKNVSSKIESILHQTIDKVSKDIESMAFNTAVSSLMVLVNSLEDEDNISRECYETVLTLLSPFAPHITEEIWESLGNTTSINATPWPKVDELKLQSKEITLVVQVNGKVRAKLVLARDIDQKTVEEKIFSLPEVKKYLGDAAPQKIIYVPNKLINVVIDIT